MIRALVARLAGRERDRVLAALAEEHAAVDAARETLVAKSDAELVLAFQAITERSSEGRIRAIACAAEAARRTMRFSPRRGQTLAALHMTGREVVELATGEGKTLALAMAAVARTRFHTSVHVLMPNGYLAARDVRLARKLAGFFGVEVGLVVGRTEESARRMAYRRPITYASAAEVAFDTLRDGLALRALGPRVPVRDAVLLDELDATLVDAGAMPIVLGSAAPGAAPSLAHVVAPLVRKLSAETDFVADVGAHTAAFTDAGYDALAPSLTAAGLLEPGEDALFSEAGGIVLAACQAALEARALMEKDRAYIVRDRGVIPVDRNTGRAEAGRRFTDGLHEALEAKEGLEVRPASMIGASTTYGVFVRGYADVAGATGTLGSLTSELAETLEVACVLVPPDAPCAREDEPDHCYVDDAARRLAVLARVREAQAAGQPVLVGTRTEEAARVLADAIEREGLAVQKLTAKNPSEEAAIVAEAARPSAITVATQVAGRGTDIVLGGAQASPEDAARVRAAGGLLVLGVERSGSRVDAQLRGRAGRRGDPGRSAFYVALDDALVRENAQPAALERARDALLRGDTDAQSIARSLVERCVTRAEDAARTARLRAARLDAIRAREQRARERMLLALRRGRPERPRAPASPALLAAVQSVIAQHQQDVTALRAEGHALPAPDARGVYPRLLARAVDAAFGVELDGLPQTEMLEALTSALADHVQSVLADRLAWAESLGDAEAVRAAVDTQAPWRALRMFRRAFLRALGRGARAHAAWFRDQESALGLGRLANRSPEKALSREAHVRFTAMLDDAGREAARALVLAHGMRCESAPR